MEIPLTAEQVRVLRKHQAAYQQALQAAVLQREYLAGLAMVIGGPDAALDFDGPTPVITVGDE